MKKIKYIILIFVLPIIVSCEDFLDRPPLDEIGMESYWKTAQDLENYIKQYYPKFIGHGNTAGNQIALEDKKSDNVITETPDRLLNGENVPTTGSWKNEWSDIRSINIFFDNYQKCEDPFELYRQSLGEAYFFRVWFYFDLLKKYGDVPWYNKPLYPESEEELMRPRDPRTLVVDSMLANLDKAILYLDTRELVYGGNNRINKETALAFKTRIALYEGTWQKYHSGTAYATPGANPNKYFQECVDAAEELINGDYSVGIYNTGKPEEDYYELFGKLDMSSVNEVLFYKAYNAAEKVGHNLQFYSISLPGQIGLTWSYVTSFLAKDGMPYNYMDLAQTAKGSDFLSTIATDCDPRLESTVWIPGALKDPTGTTFTLPSIDKAGMDLCPTGFQYRKHTNPYEPQTTANDDQSGRIIFRYAEVLLNYAEAKYELDGTVAYAQLNLLRQRVGMPDFKVITQSSDPNLVDYGYSISDELYEIRRERRVETALEVIREDDWKRWAAHELFTGKRPKGYPFEAMEFPDFTPELDENGLIDFFKGRLPNGYDFRPGQDYLDDIPQIEMTLNPNLTQNPGW